MIISRMKQRFADWRSDESGAAIIEMAFVAPIFAVGVASLVTLNSAADRKASMQDALFTSAQHVVNGGKDLTHLETLFSRNYGRAPQTFDTAMVCACAPQYSMDESDPDAEPAVGTQDYDNRSARHADAMTDGNWTQCTNSCSQSGAPIQFLEMSVRDQAPKPIMGKQVTLESTLLIRVLESLEE